jgi:hypothetical protein
MHTAKRSRRRTRTALCSRKAGSTTLLQRRRAARRRTVCRSARCMCCLATASVARTVADPCPSQQEQGAQDLRHAARRPGGCCESGRQGERVPAVAARRPQFQALGKLQAGPARTSRSIARSCSMSLALYPRVQCNVLLGVMCGNSPSQNRHVKGHRAAVACLRPCVGLCEPEIGRGLHGIWCAAAQIQALSSSCSLRMQSEATLNTKPGRESVRPALANSRCWLDAPVGTAPPPTSGQRVTAAEHVLRSPGPNTGCCRMPPTPTIAPLRQTCRVPRARAHARRSAPGAQPPTRTVDDHRVLRVRREPEPPVP